MRKLLVLLALISSSMLFSQSWETSWQHASEKAKKENHNVVLVFSGSDWCGPCIKLDKTIWQSAEFQEYADAHWVMLRADFPRKKGNGLSEEQTAENSKLAENYNQNGYFPLVVVLSPDGNVLGTTGYKSVSATDYINLLKAFEG